MSTEPLWLRHNAISDSLLRHQEDIKMSQTWTTVSGVIVRGHQVASQASKDYPRGTIEMQLPFFKSLGLDLGGCYPGTLNVSISPMVFAMTHPEHTFRDVEWTSLHPPEHFSFSRCRIIFLGNRYDGWVYYPHPETKKRHFQNPSLVEILAPAIPGIGYGSLVDIQLNGAEISVSDGHQPSG
jgi:hypothetical protein